MADLFTRYSGAPANDTGLDGQVVGSGGAAPGQDYSADGIVQRRFGVTCAYGATADQGVIIFVQPKIGASYGADNNAYKQWTVAPLVSQTVYQEFILRADDCPKDYRLNVRNDSGAGVTVTVEHESAVISDT